MRVTPQRPGVRLLTLELSVAGGTVAGGRVAGRGDRRRSALGEDRIWVTFHAPPADGLRASFTVRGDGPVTLRAIDGSDGLDRSAGLHRPSTPPAATPTRLSTRPATHLRS